MQSRLPIDIKTIFNMYTRVLEVTKYFEGTWSSFDKKCLDLKLKVYLKLKTYDSCFETLKCQVLMKNINLIESHLL